MKTDEKIKKNQHKKCAIQNISLTNDRAYKLNVNKR